MITATVENGMCHMRMIAEGATEGEQFFGVLDDVMIIISSVYYNLQQSDPTTAEVFKKVLPAVLMMPDCPAFDKDCIKRSEIVTLPYIEQDGAK